MSALRYGLPSCMSVKATQGAGAVWEEARTNRFLIISFRGLGELGFSGFGFGHLLGGFLGFVVRCGFQVFRFLASSFRFFRKNKAVFRIWSPMYFFGFSNLEGGQRQTCTVSQCSFCGCVALSTAFKLHFCSYKHVFQRFTSFVGYDLLTIVFSSD